MMNVPCSFSLYSLFRDRKEEAFTVGSGKEKALNCNMSNFTHMA
jgi:hypothetical protein